MSALPWIRLDRNMHRHWKSDLLDAALGERRTWTYVVELWLWVAEVRPDGSLDGLPDAVIARRAGYDGDAGRFVAALVEAGWMTEDRRVNDWDEYQGARKEKADRDYQRKKERRAESAQSPRGQSADNAQSPRGGSAESAGNVTVRNDTERDSDRECVQGSGVCAPSQQPEAPAALAREDPDPIIITKPEPLGPYGEDPPTKLSQLLAHVHDGETLHARWTRKALELGPDGVRAEVRKAMMHRATLSGPKFRQWAWPGPLIGKIDDWLERAREQHLRRLTTEARAAQAGVPVLSAVVAAGTGARYVRDDEPPPS